MREGWYFSDQAGHCSKLPLVLEQQDACSMALSSIKRVTVLSCRLSLGIDGFSCYVVMAL